MTKLHWSSGRVEICHIDPRTTVLHVFGDDGRFHYFIPAKEIDSDGHDIFVEQDEAPASAG